jgi:hypothetical protein
MIIPTISIAIYLLAKNWKNITERAHNATVSLWISANSIWMVGEFYKIGEAPHHLRKMALVPFALGFIVIICYYIFLHKKYSTKLLDNTVE